jgi:hypothetical protein
MGITRRLRKSRSSEFVADKASFIVKEAVWLANSVTYKKEVARHDGNSKYLDH